MSSITAQILVGTPDQFHDGINPTHYLFLSENDRPTWLLLEENIYFNKKPSNIKPIVWIPTLENMLEDAFLMISIYILKDQEILNELRNIFHGNTPEQIEIYSHLDEIDLKMLYKKNREFLKKHINLKMVITILKGSHIFNRLNALDKYEVDAEVCKSKS